MDDNTKSIEDAEVVEEVPSSKLDTSNPATSRLNLESLIHRYIKDIDSLKERFKSKKSMLEDTFQNDKAYAEAAQKVKETAKARNGVKQKIRNQPAVKHLESEVQNLKEEVNDAQSALSSYLQQYEEQTGTRYFTSEDGEEMEIVIVRKLVKKNK